MKIGGAILGAEISQGLTTVSAKQFSLPQMPEQPIFIAEQPKITCDFVKTMDMVTSRKKLTRVITSIVGCTWRNNLALVPSGKNILVLIIS